MTIGERLGDERAKAMAILFHDTYERLAPEFGYETRKDTKQFDPNSANGRLMIAVCGHILDDRQLAFQGLADALREGLRLYEPSSAGLWAEQARAALKAAKPFLEAR